MRFVAESGLWTTGPAVAPGPLTAVLELAGAVLSWTVDDRGARVHLAITDLAAADWLWRIVGETGHGAIVAALDTDTPSGEREIPEVGFVAGALDPLRRLAFGHWLRRWWPASQRDGIAELDGALLDGELALLTAAAEDFFGDGTLDSDATALLRPHTATLAALAGLADPRVVRLAQACTDLAEDTGIESGGAATTPTEPRRADYALAAGPGGAESAGAAIATGVRSLTWTGVPPGIFDAAEDTVDWRVVPDGSSARAVVRAQRSGGASAEGIAVAVRSGALHGAGEFDDAGRATVELFDAANAPVTESVAWNHDWHDLELVVGADVGEAAEVRERVRTLARSRLRQPGPDAFLAEQLAAESDY